MNFLSLIEAKRDGRKLSKEEISFFISDYVAGKIPDYQVSSLLMAVYFRGMTEAETAALTLAMRNSGDTLQFPEDPRPLVDKHSTGGVGDKVSLPLAPLLACLGFRVPMISGRGLGITGGTLDKLESIPGFTTTLSAPQIVQQVQEVGCVICGQTEQMVPADKALYALRDVTGTVPSIPLITASILSKKLAEGLNALLLDVKFGSAAFMQTREQAEELAKSMTSLGHSCGVNTRAILSDMNAPLGRAVGNRIEVKESVACLENKGPEDLHNLVLDCAAHLLVQTGKEQMFESARLKAADILSSGKPLQKWEQMLAAQGANLDAFHSCLNRDETAPIVQELKANRSGTVQKCDARIIGEIVRDLGGGRLTKDSKINFGVGIDQIAKPGEQVSSGHILARIHAQDSASAAQALHRLAAAFEIV